jgi:predicted CXXCH cytochrome family protein
VGVGIVLAAMLGAGMIAACAEPTRDRVLRFFFDGVPEPDAPQQVGYPAPTTTGDAIAGPAGSVPAAAAAFPHEPFRDNRCQGCHDTTSGGLIRSVENGLCARCHPDVPGPDRFVHGPVAVRACLFCHEAHASVEPGLLAAPEAELCLQCHANEDLSKGVHHPPDAEARCGECHDPHGGADRFFVRSRGA